MNTHLQCRRIEVMCSVTVAVLLMVMSPASPVSAFIPQQSGDVGTVETSISRKDVAFGLGSNQRTQVARAQELAMSGNRDEAEKVLQSAIAAIDSELGSTNRIRVCVASADELERFAAAHGGKARVIWVDIAYAEALHTQAFIAGGRGDYKAALSLLQREEELAPYYPGPLIERGFIFNKTGDPSAALECYRRAYDLSQQFESARPQGPAALRGMGYSLVELGDLKGARKAYEDSLTLEPGNATALGELEYIKGLESKNP